MVNLPAPLTTDELQPLIHKYYAGTPDAPELVEHHTAKLAALSRVLQELLLSKMEDGSYWLTVDPVSEYMDSADDS